MQVVQYQRNDTALLKKLAAKLPPRHSLRYPSFVDYYYGSSQSCVLWLAVDEWGEVQGSLGFERMPFSAGGRALALGFGSNYAAFEPGVGGILFLYWLRNCDLGLVFGGSADTHRILQQQRWTWYPDVRVFRFNRAYASRPGDAVWRNLARAVLRYMPAADVAERAQRMLRDGPDRVDVNEERCFTDDLLPRHSSFALRFCPTADLLNWRYPTDAPFVRYRLFRITHQGETSGYVVLNEQPRRLLIAQCDGDDPLVLTQGIFAALEAVCRGRSVHPEVFAMTSHPVMSAGFRRFGFRENQQSYPLAIGGLARGVSIPSDTSQWLVNFDWGDNGLRAPFLGVPSL